MSQIPMTVEGAQRLRDELHELKTVRRPAIIQAIAEAREHGDLKENAEYHAAVNNRAFVKAAFRISKPSYPMHRSSISPSYQIMAK